MPTTTPRHRTPIRRESVETTMQHLRASIARMEKQYGCSSEEMEAAVAAGMMEDTFEVEDWSMNYQTLKRLEEKPAESSAAGTHTKATG